MGETTQAHGKEPETISKRFWPSACLCYGEHNDVMRATTSILVALLLVFVIVGGPCLACAAILVGGANHNCCHPQNGCQERIPGSVSDCITPLVDLAKVEQASAPVLVSVLVSAPSWNFEAPQSAGGDDPLDPILHSPPDLSLRHSVLTI